MTNFLLWGLVKLSVSICDEFSFIQVWCLHDKDHETLFEVHPPGVSELNEIQVYQLNDLHYKLNVIH